MCTLIIGRDVVAPETVVIGANRDEDPARPSSGPGVLVEHPRVVGGRDLTAGGTWLAVRERRVVAAILNRVESPPTGDLGRPLQERRSRGRLVLDVVSVPDPLRGVDFGSRVPPGHVPFGGAPLMLVMMGEGRLALTEARYDPFSLVLLSSHMSFLLIHHGVGAPQEGGVGPGWHVITHRDPDDRAEPRTARVLDELAKFQPRTADDAIEGIAAILRSHGEAGAPVCLHEGRMVTVSSSLVWLARDEARYLHAEGRPCEVPYVDHSHLLVGVPERS